MLASLPPSLALTSHTDRTLIQRSTCVTICTRKWNWIPGWQNTRGHVRTSCTTELTCHVHGWHLDGTVSSAITRLVNANSPLTNSWTLPLHNEKFPHTRVGHYAISATSGWRANFFRSDPIFSTHFSVTRGLTRTQQSHYDTTEIICRMFNGEPAGMASGRTATPVLAEGFRVSARALAIHYRDLWRMAWGPNRFRNQLRFKYSRPSI